jgi:hypothetical protein
MTAIDAMRAKPFACSRPEADIPKPVPPEVCDRVGSGRSAIGENHRDRYTTFGAGRVRRDGVDTGGGLPISKSRG